MNPKYTDKPDTTELKASTKEHGNKDLEQNEDEPEEPEIEAHFLTLSIDKILVTTLPLIRTEFLESPNFLVRLRIAMDASVQDEVNDINVDLHLLP